MRRRAIDFTGKVLSRMPTRTSRDLTELAARLNAAAKPAAFPHTVPSATNRTTKPLRVTKAAANAAAIALVLDMLDDGRVERVELLNRLAVRAELEPHESA